MAVNWLESWLNNKWVHHGLRLLFASLITVLLFPFQLDLLEYTTYDWRMQLSPRPKASKNIVLVTIDHETNKRLKRDPEALDWAVVLQKIAHNNPADVVSFINPTQIQGSYDDLAMLAEVMERMPFYFGENDLPKAGVGRFDPLAAPFENVPVESTPKTADRVTLAKDGVTRRQFLSFENQMPLLPRIASRYNGIQTAEAYSGAFQFLDTTQIMIQYRNKGSYPTLSFIDIIEQPLAREFIADKIILIGKDTQEDAADYVTTPLSKDLLALSKLEMYASALDTMIHNQAPRFSPDWVKALVTFLIALATIYIVLYVRPVQGLLLLGLTVGVYMLFSLAIFIALRWIVPVAHPLMAVFICYYFVIPYRLIIENRRSWEYYQKNRLLTQVEELKSNFMRMMSHDLKTPLARIQGMTDVIRSEDGPLNDTQIKALNSISESSEELTEFIGSILSLSRIESKEMKLHLCSRDVNEILRDVAGKIDYLARRKNIEIVLELEPLFSMNLDIDLLRTVFMNIIENSIRYSPEGAKILVSTEEVNGEIVIQVADQGVGIPHEDLPHVFERFYRARNTRKQTAGSGLGLYLAKYFVELHNGRVEVESELDKGSTFTVRLPVNLSKDNESDPFMEKDEPGGLYV